MDEVNENSLFARLRQWGDERDAVRAIFLTSSRANPAAEVDAFSDYDVLLVVRSLRPFVEERGWLEDFGEVLVAYWDPVYPQPDTGIDCCGNVTQYLSGLHLDFTLWPTEVLGHFVATKTLPADLDVGYAVLLDKDGLTRGLSQPTYRAYIPEPPGAAAFHKVVMDFLSDVPYVAKCLWRGELLPAKWCLDHDMKHNFLLPMLEWHGAIANNWTVPTGMLGRGLKRRLPEPLWRDLERTYTGAELERNWEALFGTLELFRRVGSEVAEHLGYAYPVSRHEALVAYAEKVRQTQRPDA